jgi:hypothetical protein
LVEAEVEAATVATVAAVANFAKRQSLLHRPMFFQSLLVLVALAVGGLPVQTAQMAHPLQS